MSTLSAVLITISLHTGPLPFNENNYGAGIEYTGGVHNLTYGGYLFDNSYSKLSLMSSVSKQWEVGHKLKLGVSVVAGTGYEEEENAINGILASPALSVQYKGVRIQTSFPFGQAIGAYDVVNFQYVIDL